MKTQTTKPVEKAVIYMTLDQLYPHDLNPRQDVLEEDIQTLADSIKTCGLLQNLGGLWDADGKIGIVAGGRRLRALKLLANTNPDHEAVTAIPVLLASDMIQAEVWANAENTARVDLDPADEVRAYGRMANSKASVDAIANAFGVTNAHVKGRLKLAGLPEAALDALKAKVINLSVAQKLTTAKDEAAILEVLALIKDGRISHLGQIDNVLHPKAVKSTERRAAFVGVEAYEAAGGKITSDLFSEDVFFEDRDILEEVFAAQLVESAETLRAAQGWAWVDTHDQTYLGYHFIEENKFAVIYPEEGSLSSAQSERYEALMELAEGDALDDAGKAELANLQAVLDGVFTDAQKAIAGCVIYVGQGGSLEVSAGFIRHTDKKAAIEAGILVKPGHGSDAERPTKNPYSQKLRDDLDAVKLAALQNAMLDQPDLLLDLLAFQLSGMTGYGQVFDVSMGTPRNAPSLETEFDVDTRLSKPGSSPKDPWDVDLCKAFTAFKKKGRKHRDAELTRHLAQLLVGGDAAFEDVLAGKSGAEIRKVWRPTAENLFKRISGPMMEGIYADLLDLEASDEQARSFAKLKKAEKAEWLEDVFSDPTKQKLLGMTEAQKTRLATWVPDYYG